MDLSDILSNVVDQDKGRRMEIVNPWTGDGTGIFFVVAGPDSQAQRNARIAMMDELAEMADDEGKVSSEARETARINSLARCCLRMEIEEDGKQIPSNHKNIVRVLKAAAWLQAQVDTFAADRRKFGPEAE
ncbi:MULTISPECIES: hypothetical protein [unclassified Rhizobium]|uniref:hypothetical protein n=1 Tax=unclassified Rhizobium TaxID=2613769 RepID=UPI001608EC96|nr:MULTISPECIES: hypothetical protein [unclassified Rhizobium]MBB3289899.1 hypothetical protein [Rhizobium sp. BK252]MBB3404128.1 hypothetical protein [Rhizobium sp. BK289]MBB3417227.1 hypothetical protein [Rhizobium sp. BK284]MBB3485104.1 hypothetical protein [Rhizobium sp. BK347]